MYGQAISTDSRSVISSRALVSGHTRSGKPDGRTIVPCGPDHAPASHSAARASGKASKTNATCGQSGSISSASAALASSLASKLQARTASAGGTLYRVTWKERTTPAQRSIYACRASAVRTSASGFIGWPTPTTRDHKDGASEGTVPVNALLGRAAWLAGWPTPCGQDGPKGGPGQGTDRLPGATALAGWPTPMAGTPAQHGYNEAGNTDSSRKTVALAGWSTPRVTGNGNHGSPKRAKNNKSRLEDQVFLASGPARLTASGEMLTGSSARMESGGQLNPEFSRWLMGLPAAWDACAPTATRSAPRKRKSSSKQ